MIRFLTFLSMFGALLGVSCQTIPDPPPSPKLYKTGAKEIVRHTIPVGDGEVWDGKLPDGKVRYLTAHPALGDGSQQEGQKPIFEVFGSGEVRNVVIGFPAADGIHLHPGMKRAKVRKVQFWDVGEDAITVKSGHPSGTAEIDQVFMRYGTDKGIQVNATPKTRITNTYAHKVDKFARTNGDGPDWNYLVEIDNSTLVNGGTFLKISNSRGRGSLRNSRAINVKNLVEASNGAKIKTDNNSTTGRTSVRRGK